MSSMQLSTGKTTEHGTDRHEMPQTYHNGGGQRAQYIKPEQRRFIGWDGEGQDLDGKEKPQSYVLYGCSTGERIISEKGLSTVDICEFMIKIARKYPHAYHVGFAFDYDTNMIVNSLSREKIEYLYKNQYVYIQGRNRKRYCIRICRSKWISISEHQGKWDRKRNSTAKTTLRIFDIFGFFGTSFVKTVEEMLGDSRELASVREGKKHRGGSGHCKECGEGKTCPFDDIRYVARYWEKEILLLAQVAEELRKRFYESNFKITQWYGPGALASDVLKRNHIKRHMDEPETPIKIASQYAYAGGRFELFKVGRIQGPIYAYDINSAYPAAISLLPSLAGGEWRHVQSPRTLVEFGIYRVRLRRNSLFSYAPGPLFYRDKQHNISYPWVVDGWYWQPELWGIHSIPEIEILEGWEFYPANDSKPFAFVADMYETRREWKNDGNPNQIALKLAMNSIYGKMAQRVGWDEKAQRIPPWHQLEWAGWVTSYTRARLWWEMNKVPFDQLIAVETDGFYATTPPEHLGIVPSTDLGGWSLKEYEEIYYLQSGLAWMRHNSAWTDKRRGLDSDTFSLESCVEYTKSLSAVRDVSTRWAAFKGEQTRFTGMGAALATSQKDPQKFYDTWRSWRTTPKEIIPGASGKRIHIPRICPACQQGANAYDMPHPLAIGIDITGNTQSQAHYIPWMAQDVGNTEPEWMRYDLVEKEKISV